MKPAYALFAGVACQRKQNGKKLLAGTLAVGRRRTYPWEAAPDAQCNHNNVVGQTTVVEAYPEAELWLLICLAMSGDGFVSRAMRVL